MKWFTSMHNLSGVFMIVGFIVMLAGALLFASRPALAPQTRLVIERALIMAAVIFTAIGFLLLEDYLSSTTGHAWLRIGAFLYLFGGILIVAAEANQLSRGALAYPIVVTYVMIAYLAQAAIGLGIVLSSALPSLVGWVCIVWNLGWLIILVLATPENVYYPALHHMMPLVIGIVILSGREVETGPY